MAENNGAPTSAAAAANYFLRKSWEEPEYPADQMKLQKLLFYGHAWHLALLDGPLFSEDFEAWPWGLVVRDIYAQTSRFGRQPVTDLITRIRLVSQPNSPFSRGELETPEVQGADTLEFLETIWASHKKYSGIELSNATHAPGEPWTIVRDTIGVENKPTIPNDLIAGVFKGKRS